MSGIILPGTAAVGDVLNSKTFSSTAGYLVAGTMPNNATDQAASAISNSGTTLKLTAPAGYYPGTVNVTKTDANFLAGNLPSGLTLFGLSGTGNYKLFANSFSDNTDASGLLTVTGLNFQPKYIIVYQRAINGISSRGYIGIYTNNNDFYYYGNTAISGDAFVNNTGGIGFTNAVSGIFTVNSTGFTCQISFSAVTPMSWMAFN